MFDLSEIRVYGCCVHDFVVFWVWLLYLCCVGWFACIAVLLLIVLISCDTFYLSYRFYAGLGVFIVNC